MSNTKNILLIKGRSQYGAMRQYIDEIEKSLLGFGYNILTLDMTKKLFYEQLSEAIKCYSFEMMFTFNGIGTECLAFKDLKDSLPPRCSYYCDHPFRHEVRLGWEDENSIVFLCDEYHYKYVERYFPNIKRAAFIPLSGSNYPNYIPFKDRVYDIVFTGTYNDPKEIWQKILEKLDSMPEDITVIYRELVYELIENPYRTQEAAMGEILTKYGKDTNKIHEWMIVPIVRDIDQYIRVYFRDKLIRALVEAEFEIQVFGNGWENFESPYKKMLIHHKEGSYIARKAVANAKIALNIMPWFKAGFQERIATAMLSGTLVITDSSEYIDKNFSDNENIILYNLKDIEALIPKIRYLLEHPMEMEHIAERGRQLAEEKHTWVSRTAEMLEYIYKHTEFKRPENLSGKKLELFQGKYLNRKKAAEDYLCEIDELKQLIYELQAASIVDLYDYDYITKKLISILQCVINEFKDIQTGYYTWNLLSVNSNDISEGKIEFILLLLNNLAFQLYQKLYLFEKEENTRLLQGVIPKLQEEVRKNSEITIKRIVRRYNNSEDPFIKEILSVIQENQTIGPYNYYWLKEYSGKEYKIFWDSQAGMYYVKTEEDKIYYPSTYTPENVILSYRFISIEQDSRSPHRYLNDDFCVNDGEVVIDAGVAEGNFSLEVVKKASRLYLIESNLEWIKALEKTFEPYKNKVKIIPKMLGNLNDETHITIDELAQGTTVNFIKMDIEGAELEALAGASDTLKRNPNIKCAICSYHRKGDEENIKNILRKYEFEVSTTDGYMFFRFDDDSIIDGELRHGIVRGIKQKQSF